MTIAPLNDPTTMEPPEGARVISATMHRHRSTRVALLQEPPAPRPLSVRRPAHLARVLALAHHIESIIERGLVPDRAAVARGLGFTRARITQVLNLLSLAPDLQHEILMLEAVDGVEPTNERTVRAVTCHLSWADQRAAWRSVRKTSTS